MEVLKLHFKLEKQISLNFIQTLYSFNTDSS